MSVMIEVCPQTAHQGVFFHELTFKICRLCTVQVIATLRACVDWPRPHCVYCMLFVKSSRSPLAAPLIRVQLRPSFNRAPIVVSAYSSCVRGRNFSVCIEKKITTQETQRPIVFSLSFPYLVSLLLSLLCFC